eukprot:TRINITY_DN91056_c0_g1_i1.p1 TRINITY_DN91056_c0_g1~~TRINITY_DN91056_c0_g1_i1.p1  ORF type:complete len:658 (+),score=150.49 TRINITY_DN91056_c0_g1_i1:140-2113(+)
MRTGIFRTAQAVADSKPDTSEYLAPGPKRRAAERAAHEKFENAQYGGGLTALAALGFSAPTSGSPQLARLTSKGRDHTGLEAQPRELCKGTLLVATPETATASRGRRNGPAAAVNEWKPFDVTHHHDGRLTLRSSSQSAVGPGGFPTQSVGADGSVQGAQEYLLDADWRRPFIAAPWQPIHGRGSKAAPLAMMSAAQEQEAAARRATPALDGEKQKSLYPFTLSYEPVTAMPGEAEHPAPTRRTVVLAATDLQTRGKWLNTFSQKATTRAMRIRPTPPMAYPTSPEMLSPSMRLAAIGERHAGLPTLASTSSAPTLGISQAKARKQLAAGHAGLWDKCSRLKIVRELYDGYASDPLGEVERSQRAQTTTSPQAAASRRLLERYVERQAKLEGLLEEKRCTGRVDFHQAPRRSGALKETPSTAGGEGYTDDEEGSRVPSPHGAALGAMAAAFDGVSVSSKAEAKAKASECPFPILGVTPNMTVDGAVLQNDEWSAGCMFSPKNISRFKLTVKPEDRVDYSPVFLGIAPADSDLTMVNFFDVGGGVFLCMGGIASEALIASLGAPGGPSFHAFGQRSVAELPVASHNATLSVEYCEEIPDGKTHPEGQVLFSLTEPDAEEGDGAFYARPILKQRLPVGKWRPCVLLCMPRTRMHIVSLT